jgi:hypothetical protein
MKTLKRHPKVPLIFLARLALKLVVISGLLFSAVSCDEDDQDGQIDIFTANLSGANVVPPNQSDATGFAELRYNRNTRIFRISVEYSGFEGTGAHIHRGEEGVNGPVIFGFDSPASPINYTSQPLTSFQEGELYNGLYYISIHSEDFPGGEIRGQLRQE